MDIAKKLLIIGLILLGIGTISAGIVSINNHNNEKEIKKVNIPVAKTELAEGQIITPEDYDLIPVKEEDVPTGIITDENKILGFCISSGNFITNGDYFQPEKIVKCEDVINERVSLDK